ncbi:SPFH domain-containing protein [Microbacterium hominis]|uniref:Flotillin family protein n=1 Tax=Microbacterium hominis TaxID=162426 RepID=A0A7D4UHK1_9MICO|nr:SPFH domain-containing protein [Microbacterium hominis]QKJ18608.1 flotillin family protein [Microbacterium hominis]
MDPFSLFGAIVPIVLIGIAALVVFFIGVLIFRAWYRVAKADEALVIVGKTQKSADGQASRISVITGGGAIVNPITQRSELVSLRARQIKMEPVAQSSNGVTVNVSGVALVKIGSEPDAVRRAAERFASQDKAIEQFTTEQLEGALRGVVATLTVEELMRDRQRLSDQIAEGIKSDLSSQGLILDSFQIQGVTDSNGYIAALGAAEVERVKRDAEVAEINARREIKARELATSEATLIEQTAYDKNTAAAKAEVGRANAEAEQAEALAHAQSEQGVLQQRAENRQAQLDADVKRVADAKLYERQRAADAEAYEQVKAAEAQSQIAEEEAKAIRLRAEAEADAIRLAGAAKAEALAAEAEALAQNQSALLAQRALDALPNVMAEFAKGFERVGTITVLGGDGASSHIAGESAIGLRSVFDSVKSATGLDIASIIQGRAVGEGIGASIAAETNGSSKASAAASTD